MVISKDNNDLLKKFGIRKREQKKSNTLKKLIRHRNKIKYITKLFYFTKTVKNYFRKG